MIRQVEDIGIWNGPYTCLRVSDFFPPYSKYRFLQWNQNEQLCWIWAANNYKKYFKCRVNVRKVVSFLLKHPLLKSYWFYKRHFLWRQFGFKYVPNQNGLDNEYKSFLKKIFCTCIFTNFESFKTFFFDMDKKKNISWKRRCIKMLFQKYNTPSQGHRKVCKSGRALCTLVDIICTLGWYRVNCSAKNWGGGHLPFFCSFAYDRPACRQAKKGVNKQGMSAS